MTHKIIWRIFSMQSACPCTLFLKYQRQKMWPEFCRIDLLLNKYNVSWSTRWDGCPGYAKLNWFSIKYAPASSGRAYKWGSWSHFWLNKRKKSVSTCTQRWTWTVSTCTQHWTWTWTVFTYFVDIPNKARPEHDETINWWGQRFGITVLKSICHHF